MKLERKNQEDKHTNKFGGDKEIKIEKEDI